MKKVEKDDLWCLFCPDECKHLTDAYGDKFDQLYNQYESQKKYRKQVRARAIWKALITSQIETGTPYLLYKNAANKKSNQQSKYNSSYQFQAKNPIRSFKKLS